MKKNTRSIRLFIADSLHEDAHIMLDSAQAHYLRHVMRVNDGDIITAFNGENGAWQATVQAVGKKDASLIIGQQISPPHPCPDIWLAFAMVKNKNDIIVEKATELGVQHIHLIVMERSMVKSANEEKLIARATEAAEQCERFDIPTITCHTSLSNFLASHPQERTLYYGDESGNGAPLPEILTNDIITKPTVLIGAEGGFSPTEHQLLQATKNTVGFGMGRRIMRADTAAIASLSCIIATMGDWQQRPHFIGNA